MDDITRGAKLKDYRQRHGHSIAKAARSCEVGERAWRRWEQGQVALPMTAIKCYHLANGETFVREDWE